MFFLNCQMIFQAPPTPPPSPPRKEINQKEAKSGSEVIFMDMYVGHYHPKRNLSLKEK